MKSAWRLNPCIAFGNSEGRFANRPYKRLICVLLLGLVLTSCTLLRPKPFGPIPQVARGDLSPAQIYSLLDQRTPPLSSLWAHMKIYLSGQNIKGKKFFEATLLYQISDEPARQENSWAGKLRLRGYRTITSTLFECLALPDRIQVYLNKDRELYSGTPQTLRTHPALFFGINPTDIARALEIERTITHVVQEIHPESKSSAGKEQRGTLISPSSPISTRIATLPGHYVFIRTRHDNTKQVFVMRKTDLLIDRIALYDSHKRLALEVTYHQYDLFDGHLLPIKMTVQFIESQVTMTAKVIQYKVNTPFQPAVFRFALPASVREYPLEALLKRTS
jgi:hypothetical protein